MIRRLVFAAVVAVVAGAFLFAGCKNEGPTGKATGTVARSPEAVEFLNSMWGMLSEYQGSFLQSYESQFKSKPEDPLAILRAFDELMYAVTGPSGLWRSYVPKQHFGCAANHTEPICMQLQKLDLAFLPWETFHVQLSTIDSADEAEAFLTMYSGKLKQFVEYYVPNGRGLDAIQGTLFFKDQLSMFLPR